MTEEANKAALKRFYEKKDPHRVKNVEPLFMRYEQDDILYFVEIKYGETPEGWVHSEGGSGYDLPTSPLAVPENRRSQGGGLLGAAKGLFGSQKSMRQSQSKSSLSIDPARKSMDRPRDSRDSEDSDAGTARPQSGSLLPPTSPVAMHATKSMAELKVDGDHHPVEIRTSSPSPSPSPSPPTVQQIDIPNADVKTESPSADASAPPAMSAEEVTVRLEEAKARERAALEEARAEERRIQEKLARGREAIERAKRELEEKELELDAMRKKLAEEARQEAKQQIAQGKPVTTDGPDSAAVEELKKAQAEVEQKQIETIGKLEEAEKERIILEEKKQLVKIEEAERTAKIQLIETFEAPAEAKADDDEEKHQGDESGDVVGDLPAQSEEPSLMEAAPKRMTLYERKLQAALDAPSAAAEEPAPVSSSGRKTLLGGLVSRLTISSRRKSVAQPPPPVQESAPVIAEEPAAPVEEAPAPVVPAPAISIPAPAFAAPTSIVTDLSADELEKWKLRALEAESRTKVLQMEAEERARKFQMEAEERIRKLEAMAAAAFKPQAAPAPEASTPAATATAGSTSGGAAGAGTDLNGYKLMPRDHPDLNKFHKMAKAGLPQGAVENAMIREGFHPKSVFDNPMNDPKAPGKPVVAAAPAPAAAAASSSGGGEGEYKRPPQDSPDLEKYKKMQKAGLPQGAIENAMMRDFIHPAAIFGANAINDPKPPKKVAVAGPAAAGGGGGAQEEFKKLPQDSPDLEKYKKMQKAGLPQGAVENAMMRDMVHPASLYGASAINDPKPPKAAGGAKPAAGGAKPAAAAAPAASAAPVDPSKPPPGMSMMEEMKWKQAQKAKAPQKAFVEPAKKPDAKPASAAAAAPPGPNDKPPPGLSMMEEMKWKQAQKAALAAAGGGPAPIKEPPKKQAPAPAQAPKVALKSTPNAAPATKAPVSAPGAVPKPATPAAPAWSKPPAKAVVQAAANLAAAPPPPNVDALVNLLVGAKITPDNAKKYATALAREGFDAPDKLALLDEGDLTACGITVRFDIKTILSLKNNLPKPAAAPPVAAATAAKPGAAAPAAAAKPGAAAPVAAAKPGAVSAAKPGAPAPATAPAKPGAAAPAAAGAKPGAAAPAAAAKPGAAASPAAKPAVGAGAASKPSVPATTGGFQKPALKSSADAQAQKDAERLAFVMALGAPTSAYKKPKQIG